MKQFLLIFCLIGLSLGALDIPDHLKAPLKILHKACQAETNAPEEMIQQSRDGFIPDNEELKCYILCILEHAGMIEEDPFSIHFKEVAHLLTPSMQATVDIVTEKCGTQHGSTKCETAYLTIKCFFETVPEGSELP